MKQGRIVTSDKALNAPPQMMDSKLVEQFFNVHEHTCPPHLRDNNGKELGIPGKPIVLRNRFPVGSAVINSKMTLVVTFHSILHLCSLLLAFARFCSLLLIYLDCISSTSGDKAAPEGLVKANTALLAKASELETGDPKMYKVVSFTDGSHMFGAPVACVFCNCTFRTGCIFVG